MTFVIDRPNKSPSKPASPKLRIASVFPLRLLLCHLLCLPILFFALVNCASADNNAILKLKEIQSKVGNVVSKNMKACVAVSDGVGFGSGVIISEDGLVLTAGHVMASSDNGQYEVILSSGKVVRAKALGKNLDVDSGMIQIIDEGPFPFVELEKTNKFKQGQWVVSLGHSGGWKLGRKPPVRTGRILARKKHQILTDAVLIGGDSGGPLFNLDGELIAIHSSIGDSVAENRHVPVSSFRRDWDRLKQGNVWGKLPDLNDPSEKKKRGLIGIKLDLKQSQAVIRAIDQGMPAEQIGLEVGDIVLQFDNTIVQDGRHLIDIIKRKSAGDVCPIVIIRNGNQINYEIILR